MGKMYLNGILYGVENRFKYDLLLENTNFTPDTSGNSKERSYTLRKSIDEYDAVVVFGWLNVSATAKDQLGSMLIMNQDFYARALSDTSKWVFLLNGSQGSGNRRLVFRFADSTTIETLASKSNTNEEPRLWKIYGLKFPSDDENTRYSEIPIYLGSQVIFPTRIGTSSSSRTNFYCAGVDANNDAQQFNIITRNMTIPTGYEVQYRLSAIFNSQERNTAQLYVNDTLISESGTWASGSGESAYIGHYGNCIMSPLFKFTNITPEQRYIGTQGQMGFNINIRSSVNGQYACIENLTIHAYLVKTGGYYVDENDQVYTDENGNRYSDIYV